MQIYLTATDHKWYLDHDALNVLGNNFRVNENGLMNLATKNGSTLYLNYHQVHVSSYASDEPAVLFMEYRDMNNTRECVQWTTCVLNFVDANDAVDKFLKMIPYEL